MNFLKTKGILGKDWVRDDDTCISMSSTKNYIRDQIDLMNNRDEKEWMESVCGGGSFPFTYNGIADKNPNPGHNIKRFRQGRFVAAEFSTHAINFRSKTTLKGTFRYNFCLWSIYLIEESKTISTPSKQKRDPDEWIVSSPRTRKSTVKVKLAKHSTIT